MANDGKPAIGTVEDIWVEYGETSQDMIRVEFTTEDGRRVYLTTAADALHRKGKA